MTNLEMNQNIAEFIGNYCTKWNISVTKFAEKCGISYMTIKRIMAGTVMKIDVYTIACIADATRTPLMEILGMHNENLDLYKRISHTTPRDRQIITNLINLLEKLHISGRECKEIPCASLSADRKSYLLDNALFSGRKLDPSRLEKIAYRSTFTEGFSYMGFHLPDNHLYPIFQKDDTLLTVNQNPMAGEIGAFAWKEEGHVRLIFRRVEKTGRFLELNPVTNYGRSYIIDTENMSDLMNWICVGVVTGIIR